MLNCSAYVLAVNYSDIELIKILINVNPMAVASPDSLLRLIYTTTIGLVLRLLGG